MRSSSPVFTVNFEMNVEGDWTSDPLGLISKVKSCTDGLVENLIEKAVRIAREQGHTWAEVGQALGVSRQAAWQRFSPDD